ncbi:MAG: DMT family transporter [Betaproteobacteria bacterium]
MSEKITGRAGLAISFALASAVVLATMDAFAKLLLQDYPVLMVAWARFGVMALLYGAISWRSFGWRMFRPHRMRVQCLRASVVVFATLAFYQGLIVLPLAECVAIVFVAPILTALISSRFLGERANRATWISLAGSFLGVLLIVRPGSELFSWAALFPLASAVGLALYQVTTRAVSQVDDPRVTMFFTSIVVCAAFSLALPFGFAAPHSGADLGLMVLVGVLGATGQLILTFAFRYAQAAVVASVGYSALIWSVAIGWIMFGHVPDAWSLLGMVVIALSGIVLVKNGGRT